MPPTFEPRFLSNLYFEDKGGFPFILTESLGYVTNVEGKGTFFVPKGFQTDLASIPQILWNILPPIGAYDAAAVLHDFLYVTGYLPERGQADAVLEEAMKVLGVGDTKRRLIYWGVRLGGWRIWRKYRAAK